MGELIGKRYASALFDVAVELNKQEKFYEELVVLRNVFLTEDDFIQFLYHPKVKKAEKKDFILQVFQGKLSAEIINFLFIIIDKNRHKEFVDMTKMYEDLYYDYKGILRVSVVTAVSLEDDIKERLKDVLTKKLGKEIELTNKVDESTIGGVRLELDGKLIDGTIQGKLNSMARMFKTAIN